METIVYRKIEEHPWMQELHASERTSNIAGMPDAVRETGPLSLDLFFPAVTEEEMVTWTHWLPNLAKLSWIVRSAGPAMRWNCFAASGPRAD